MRRWNGVLSGIWIGRFANGIDPLNRHIFGSLGTDPQLGSFNCKGSLFRSRRSESLSDSGSSRDARGCPTFGSLDQASETRAQAHPVAGRAAEGQSEIHRLLLLSTPNIWANHRLSMLKPLKISGPQNELLNSLPAGGGSSPAYRPVALVTGKFSRPCRVHA